MNVRVASTLTFALALALTVSGSKSDPTATAIAAVGSDPSEGRGHMKNMMMNPYMMIPQLIALGFAPIVLANLKMMVMSALMINNMALNAAIFMLVRNMVFGPRPTVKYVNYGYRDHHQHQQHRQQYFHPHLSEQGRPTPQVQEHPSEQETETSDRRKRAAVVSS